MGMSNMSVTVIRRVLFCAVLLLALALLAGAPSFGAGGPALTPAAESSTPAEPTITVFAMIGDFGSHDGHAAAVAALVKSWHPAFIVTTGDDYYKQAGGKGADRYRRSVATYYAAWMKGVPKYHGRKVGTAKVNAFFPALGNHDYTDARPSPKTYLNYFTLPGAGFTSSSGSERYYDFTKGPIHFFILDSNPQEPRGVFASSRQAQWLQRALASSTSSWNVVVDHHPPFSSDTAHGSTVYMQWPFAEWGADVVISGHAHVYERFMHDGIPYIVNGLGGGARHSFAPTATPESAIQFDTTWGAQRVTETSSKLRFEFYDVSGQLIDQYDVWR